MERIATISPECFFVNRNLRQERMMKKKAVSIFGNILKDCLTLSVVIMIGAALTFLLGS